MTQSWAHDQDLSFKGVRDGLREARGSVSKMLEEEKQKLARLVAARDGFRR